MIENTPIPRAASVIATALVLAGLVGTPVMGTAFASTEGPTYKIPVWAYWTDPVIEIVIVPSAAFPAADSSAQPAPAGGGVGPGSPYVQAVRDAVEAWNTAIAAHVDVESGDAYLSELDVRATVLGADATQADLGEADIRFVFTPHQGTLAGAAPQNRDGNQAYTQCDIAVAQAFILPFTVNDMYNVAAHEIGHCLAVVHPADPSTDLMAVPYAYQPGDPTTPRLCISSLDVKGLAVAYQWLPEGSPAPLPADHASVHYTEYRLYPAVGGSGSCPNTL